jgi:hypothetical protein
MNPTVGKWRRRLLLATLPFGIVLAVAVLVRVALMVTGSEPVRAGDVVWVLIEGPTAVILIWSGRENRRAVSASDTTPR